jgi:hypothetical protein
MEVTGKIKVIGNVETFGTDFTKRNLVVTTNEQYPQDLSLEFVKDKCSLLDKFNVGDEVKVGINLRGREWINPEGVSKYFNSIVGWRIDKQAIESGVSEPVAVVAGEPDDLPF